MILVLAVVFAVVVFNALLSVKDVRARHKHSSITQPLRLPILVDGGSGERACGRIFHRPGQPGDAHTLPRPHPYLRRYFGRRQYHALGRPGDAAVRQPFPE